MGIAELKAAQTPTNDNLNGLRNDVQGIARTVNQGFNNLQYSRPYSGPQYPTTQYPGPRQPSFPPRGGFTPRPQYGYATNPRPQRAITQGLTGGPGYVNRPISTGMPNPRPLAPMESLSEQSSQQSATQHTTPQQPNQQPTMEDMGQTPYFSNPNLPQLPEMGAFDTGFGWTNSAYNTNTAENYDTNPSGAYSYGGPHF